MKKITWLFMSLMLLLGVGTAFAQLPAPTITPGEGSSVNPGQVLTLADNPAYGMYTSVLYTFDDAVSFDAVDADFIQEMMMDGLDSGEFEKDGISGCVLFITNTNGIVNRVWMGDVTVPTDASGAITLRACAFDMDGNSSDITTIHYTAGGEVVSGVLAPTFSPAAGAVAAGASVSLSTEETGLYYIYYVLDDPDFDFTQYETDDDVPYKMAYSTPITINEETTITAATAKVNMMTQRLAWSNKVSATYTIREDAPLAPKPAAPTFTPDGGEIASGVKITLTNGTENGATPLKIYYNFNNDNGASITKFTTQEALTKEVNMQYTATVFLYADTGIKITEAKNIQALTANVNEDGVITWSDVTMKAFTIAIAPEPPVAPVFNPDGGEVTVGAKVILTNGTESDATPKPIYYNIKNTGSAEFDVVKTQTQLTSAVNNIAKKLILYPAGGIEITKATSINAATADIDADGNVTWSEVITKNFTIGAATATLVAPTFNPDGGEVEADEEITLTTTTTGAKIYYIDAATADFVNLTTEEALNEAANGLMPTAIKYSETTKPTLSDLNVKAKCSLSAAAVLIAADGSLTWSDVTTREFTVKAGETPVVEVAIPVITPANDAQVHIGDMVTITCETEDAEIYYTTDGTAPFTEDKDGYPVAIKEGALKYTEPFALTQEMLVRQRTVWSLKIRAVATKGDAISPNGGSAGYVVYPDAPAFSPVAGAVKEGTKVAIKCVPDSADIYYTTDGTTPTMEESPRYTDSIEITEAMTIKALAVLG
ncbi:MAG: chitobiase/beta-hexosaminidase C-terminal domain-containing protein, partial [Bacteroidales bacterium]|nr:chitobiase/beta-hexosaminidase C-terminal domain-containing protein [Bacteroidales bacterium]